MANDVKAKSAMNFPAPAAAESARAPAPKAQQPQATKGAGGKSFTDELAKPDQPAKEQAFKPVAKGEAPAKDAVQAKDANEAQTAGDAQAKAAVRNQQEMAKLYESMGLPADMKLPF